jgi:predicted polyphosphate/ATP-dependent NAD kinase
MQRKFRLGLIVNPFSGIGGAVALKGSDGPEIRQQALEAGAQKLANPKTLTALSQITQRSEALTIVTAGGELGEDVALQCVDDVEVVYRQAHAQSEAEDTIAAVRALSEAQIDMLVFAGGDGTARNVCEVFSELGDTAHFPVLGIPTGCKIHSGVFAISAQAAGQVIQLMLNGELVSACYAEVKDIDESRFREGVVVARTYGEMRIPEALQYVQAVKMGGKESDELVLADLAAMVEEIMHDHPEHYFVMGSGSTLDFVANELGLSNTLLGVDVVHDFATFANDVTAAQLLEIVQQHPCKLLITIIGGQGHVFGRGNQQLSPAVIRAIGRENLIILATKQKLGALAQRPLVCDTGDPALDEALSGLIAVTTGYRDQVFYRLGVDYANQD